METHVRSSNCEEEFTIEMSCDPKSPYDPDCPKSQVDVSDGYPILLSIVFNGASEVNWGHDLLCQSCLDHGPAESNASRANAEHKRSVATKDREARMKQALEVVSEDMQCIVNANILEHLRDYVTDYLPWIALGV